MIVAVLFSILLPYPGIGVLAQTCDPLPTDPDLLLECNFYDNQNFPPKTYAPGTDPSNPVVFPATGQHGIGVVYNPTNDSVLIAAHQSQNNSFQIMGVLADPRTLVPKGNAFRIDTAGGAFVGAPKVAYSPDQNKFLVVWEDSRRGDNFRDHYGRLVSGNGVPEGNSDFAINQTVAFLGGVVYDSVNQRFVVGYEEIGRAIKFKTVNLQGTVSNPVTAVNSFPYQGQMGLTVNTGLNEYWFAYAVTLSGGDTAKEDDRIMLSRINAQTLAVVGQPVQLSQTRIGRNALSYAKIAYSNLGQGTMVTWMERDRQGIAGVWGKTVYDDGTLSSEYPVITPQTNPYSDGYGDATLNYNPWTDSFFVSTGDWDGNAWITEIDLSGLVYSNEPVIGVSGTTGAVGSFNVTGAVTPYGAATLASRNYVSVVGTSYASINAPGPAPAAQSPGTPNPAQPVDTSTLPKLINQLYVWGLGISVLLALLMMVLGGYYIMTAAGNAEQATKGKEFITSALIGVVIIFTAYLLLNEINPDLVNFNLNSLSGLNP